ncbi:hypothetical protein AAU61_14095 [Desulfocarbo indianensis]|nr:hypothetical protein AAU61_14095 [Desulfocarbo indianensis]
MTAKKMMSVVLALALALALSAAPVFAAGQEVMDEWNCPMDQSGAKGGAPTGQAELKGSLAPGGGSNMKGNFSDDKNWNPNPQVTSGGGNFDGNFGKNADWK